MTGYLLGNLTGAALVVLGLALSRLRRPRRREVKPICGCRHHRSYHKDGTGECHALVDGEPVKYNEYKDPTAWAQVQCPCQKYHGPEPLPPSFYSEAITD